MSNIESTVQRDVTTAETAVKGVVSKIESTVSKVEADVKAAEGKTYSFGNVAIVAGIALVVGIFIGAVIL